jgi:hypothetical protein
MRFEANRKNRCSNPCIQAPSAAIAGVMLDSGEVMNWPGVSLQVCVVE